MTQKEVSFLTGRERRVLPGVLRAPRQLQGLRLRHPQVLGIFRPRSECCPKDSRSHSAKMTQVEGRPGWQPLTLFPHLPMSSVPGFSKEVTPPAQLWD